MDAETPPWSPRTRKTARRIVTATSNDEKIDSAATIHGDALAIRPSFLAIQLADKAFEFNALLAASGDDILDR